MMSNDTPDTYHTDVAQAIRQTLEERGPLALTDLLDCMIEDETGYSKVNGVRHPLPIDVVQRILNHHHTFFRDDSGRWHLGER